MNAAILLAAGKGARMKECVPDKVLVEVNQKTLFLRCLEAFLEANVADTWIITYRDSLQKDLLSEETEKLNPRPRKVIWVKGGQERRDSVRNALSRIPEETKIIFVHDCARPMIQPDSLVELLEHAVEEGAAALGRPVQDTLKQIDDMHASKPQTCGTARREMLWAVETPQVFQKDLLLDGMRKAKMESLPVTDETSAVELLARSVRLINPAYPNPKVTTSDDLNYVEFLLTKSTT